MQTLSTHASPTIGRHFSAIGTVAAIVTAGMAFPSHAAEPVCVGNSARDVMVKVGDICVDKYEASIWSEKGGVGHEYPHSHPFPATFAPNGNWTERLYAASVEGVSPATNVTWFQAQQACALSGKRLLTNAEWQMAAAGTPDPGLGGNGKTTCNTNSTGRLPTGSAPACVSNWGVADMVGNLNEWVSDWTQGPGGVTAGSIGTAWNPDTFTRATPEYGSDQVGGINDAFHDHSPQAAINPLPAAIYRGGMWGNEERAGVFMLQATLTPSSRNNALGFRCARTALVPDGTPPMR